MLASVNPALPASGKCADPADFVRPPRRHANRDEKAAEAQGARVAGGADTG
jgi:hypothetical protein